MSLFKAQDHHVFHKMWMGFYLQPLKNRIQLNLGHMISKLLLNGKILLMLKLLRPKQIQNVPSSNLLSVRCYENFNTYLSSEEMCKRCRHASAEGSEFSAELEFHNQQNLILSMENNALKQHLESLSQEKLIKYMEHEVLEREVGRLRALYQQQQQQQQQQHPSSGHRRSNSKDLDSQHRCTNSRDYDSQHRRTNSRYPDLQFANLCLKPKDASSGQAPVSGSLHI